MERRTFLQTLTAALPGILWSCREPSEPVRDSLGEQLPLRTLGRTGEAVTMLGLGGFHVGWTTERDAQETIEMALEKGIRFFDTAESYQEGESERRYGRFLTPKYREDVFLMTKTTGRDAETVRRHLDESLARMQTDYLDLWQVHSLQDAEDVDNRLQQGVLDVFLEAKASGKTRFIGFTGHRDPAAHLRMLEQTASDNPFDTCQMPVNVVDLGRDSFVRQVVPRLQEQSIGLLAMKTLADGRFFAVKRRLEDIQWETDDPVVPDRISLDQVLHFAWSLPISTLITGAENARYVAEKADLARSFTAMNATEREALAERVADLAAAGSVEYYKDVS